MWEAEPHPYTHKARERRKRRRRSCPNAGEKSSDLNNTLIKRTERQNKTNTVVAAATKAMIL